MVEAKLFNRLSAGVKNAPEFDQAARTVACLAETLRRAGRDPEDLEELAFVVVAPAARIDDGAFAWEMTPESIRIGRSGDRVADYEGDRDAWFRDWFEPTLERVEIGLSELGRPPRSHRAPRPRLGSADRQLLRPLPAAQPTSRSLTLFPGRRGRAGLPCVPGSPRRP